MKRALIIGFFAFVLPALSGFAQTTIMQGPPVPVSFCISAEEFALYKMINDYRKKYGLPAIPLSKSLSFVANTHAKDLYVNHPDQGDCNFHSWSDKGSWSPFCYPADEDKKRSVWDKPRELTPYPAKGYEIVFWENAPSPNDSIIAFWQSISYFNNFLKNSGKWEGKKWNAIGIGKYETYACAWFGEVADPEGPPTVCGQASIAATAPVKQEEPVIQKTTAGLFYIIVKSQRPLTESKELAASLVAKGYPDASVLESDGKIRVYIFKCLTREEANQKLSEARKLYKDAWILVP